MFQVRRSETLEFSIPDHLRKSEGVTRADVVASLKTATGANFKFIKCVQASPNRNSYHISFKANAQIHKENLFTRGLFIKGLFLHFSEAETSCAVVTVRNLPCELEDDDVATFFKDFGVIKKIARNVDVNGLETRDRRIFITLSHHIPHMVFSWACCKAKGHTAAVLFFIVIVVVVFFSLF